MKTSQAGIDLIKSFEGCRLTAYKATPTEKYWTCGWGRYSPDIKEGQTITQAQADAWLVEDLAKYEKAVDGLGLALNQNQFDALVSFAYNCGVGNLRLLTKNRTLTQIADAIPRYNKAGGKVLAGLTRRRNAERELFLKGATAIKSVSDIAREVLGGRWGNGADRQKRLTAAGYSYSAVQKEVNRILHG